MYEISRRRKGVPLDIAPTVPSKDGKKSTTQYRQKLRLFVMPNNKEQLHGRGFLCFFKNSFLFLLYCDMLDFTFFKVESTVALALILEISSSTFKLFGTFHSLSKCH